MGQDEFILIYGFYVGFGIQFISRGLRVSNVWIKTLFVVFRIGIGIGGRDGQVYVCVVLILDYVSYVSEARGCVIGKINLNFVSFILQLGDLDLLRLVFFDLLYS